MSVGRFLVGMWCCWAGLQVSCLVSFDVGDGAADGAVGDVQAEDAGGAVCGNGVAEGGEACDGADLRGLDCSRLNLGSGKLACREDCTLDLSGCDLNAECGNGLVEGMEECDDGNLEPGDGCGVDCSQEVGWRCGGTPSECDPVCGDAVVVGDEECDDGNADSGDGCDGDCRVEDYFTCAGEPSACACRVFVNQEATGDPDGKSWDTAFRSITEAAERAAGLVAAGAPWCQVWVAQGEYRLGQDQGADVVVVADAVEVYGGFCGGEDRLEERPTEVTETCRTILSGDSATGSAALVRIEDAAGSRLDGLTLRYRRGSSAGGGLAVGVGARVVLTRCRFENNRALTGGALFVARDASVDATDVVFFSNEAESDGGAVVVEDGAVLRGARLDFEANRAAYGAARGGGVFVASGARLELRSARLWYNLASWAGGGLSVDGQAVVWDVEFQDNTASMGGAVSVVGTLDATRCSFEANNAGDSGGGVLVSGQGRALFVEGEFARNSAPDGGAAAVFGNSSGTCWLGFVRCVFVRNSAGNGAAVAVLENGKMVAANSLFATNTVGSGGQGGAVLVSSGSWAGLYNSTVADNDAEASAGRAGVVVRASDARESIVEILDSVLWHNQGSDIYVGTESKATVGRICYGGWDVDGSLEIRDDTWSGDPSFLNPVVGDYRLAWDSPCLDRGQNVVEADLDLAGNPRAVDLPGVGNDGWGVVDLGAYERQNP